jgi:CDP-4-dehydro-6-deoxyglucose reductase, E3
MNKPTAFAARLASARMLTSSVRELTFERDDGAPLAFEAGQWVSLDLPVDDALRRSYSIASAPDGSPRFEIAVTKVDGGRGSTYLHMIEPGTKVTASGPQGFFTRPSTKTGPSLFVGTGTGVTPLRSMLKDAVAKGDTRPLWLVLGVRTEADLLYRAEFDALAAKNANVRVFYTLSRGADDWTGLRGYVQTHTRALFTELVDLGQGAPHAYICGLERMVTGVREVLRKEMLVPREQVHSERYD